MSSFVEIVTAIWNYKLSLAPVLFTYFLFDLTAIVRRLTGVAYVPMYFLFFPLGHSDRLYAQYFNEDYVYGDGASMTDDEKRVLRHRIQATAIFSMVFAAIVAPWICGFAAAFYLTQAQFFEFLVFLVVVKAGTLVWALNKLRHESVAATTGGSFYLVSGLYVVYLILIVRGLTKAYEWTYDQRTKGFASLLWNLLDYAYVDIFINVIIVGAITWGVTMLFTSPVNIPKTQFVEVDEQAEAM